MALKDLKHKFNLTCYPKLYKLKVTKYFVSLKNQNHIVADKPFSTLKINIFQKSYGNFEWDFYLRSETTKSWVPNSYWSRDLAQDLPAKRQECLIIIIDWFCL